MSTISDRPRAIIIGGSLGGLFAGSLLKDIDWNVDIYERSEHELDSRGGGIVLQPDVLQVFRRTGAGSELKARGVTSTYRTVFAPDGTVLSKKPMPQTQTSWSLIYTAMKKFFGNEHYHQGRILKAVRQNEAERTVTAIFEDGSEETGDLLIGADGNNSTVRKLLWPENEATYSGYLAWRGLVDEADMPEASREGLHGDFAFASHKGSHMLGYLVPGHDSDVRPGHRLYNWVWYRTADEATLADIMTDKDGRYRGFALPEGKITDKWRQHVYDEADRILPPAFREIVHATEEPFGQAIRDLTVQQMVKERVILLGDAAFIPRPHTAASTSKAASNAMDLVDALSENEGDIDAGLKAWEPNQLFLGDMLYEQGSQTGNYLMFGQRAIGQQRD